MKTNGEKVNKKAKKGNWRWVIVGNDKYGLYYGRIKASDREIAESKSVRCYECRHVYRWYGARGGITSLAALGVDLTKENRIGAPCAEALLTGVVNVFAVSDNARSSLDRVSW